MHGKPEFAVTDTAELDAWLAENLLGWRMLEGQLVPPEMARLAGEEGENFPLKPRAPVLSTTGDGRQAIENAMAARGYTLVTLHSEGNQNVAAFYDIGARPYSPLMVMEHLHGENRVAADGGDDLNRAVAQAARVALEAEA